MADAATPTPPHVEAVKLAISITKIFALEIVRDEIATANRCRATPYLHAPRSFDQVGDAIEARLSKISLATVIGSDHTIPTL